MSPEETPVPTPPGFLSTYRLRRAYARLPEAERGQPGLRYATDDSGEPVLVRTWPALGASTDQDLTPFWHHELRALRRLSRRAVTEALFASMSDAGADSTGFHLVHALDSHQLLPDILALPREPLASSRGFPQTGWKEQHRAQCDKWIP